MDTGVKKILHGNRRFKPSKKKKFDDDREALCKLLIQKLGSTWDEASTPRAHGASKLLGDARATRNTPRPWEEVQKVLTSNDYEPWLQSHIDDKLMPLLAWGRK